MTDNEKVNKVDENTYQTSFLGKERDRLIRDAQEIGGVAEALVVFEAALARAPYVPPLSPEFRFSTGTNT